MQERLSRGCKHMHPNLITLKYLCQATKSDFQYSHFLDVYLDLCRSNFDFPAPCVTVNIAIRVEIVIVGKQFAAVCAKNKYNSRKDEEFADIYKC